MVTVSWVNDDVAIALGVVPVGVPKNEWGGNDKGSTPWKDAALEKLGAGFGSDKAPAQFSEADGINFTEIAKLNPDVILGAYSGLTEEDYKKLSEIAPVVAHPELAYGTSWQDSTTIIGKALGKEAEATKLVSDTEATIKDKVAKYPQIEGKTFIYGNLEPAKGDGVNVYTANDNRPEVPHRDRHEAGADCGGEVEGLQGILRPVVRREGQRAGVRHLRDLGSRRHRPPIRSRRSAAGPDPGHQGRRPGGRLGQHADAVHLRFLAAEPAVVAGHVPAAAGQGRRRGRSRQHFHDIRHDDGGPSPRERHLRRLGCPNRASTVRSRSPEGRPVVRRPRGCWPPSSCLLPPAPRRWPSAPAGCPRTPCGRR